MGFSTYLYSKNRAQSDQGQMQDLLWGGGRDRTSAYFCVLSWTLADFCSGGGGRTLDLKEILEGGEGGGGGAKPIFLINLYSAYVCGLRGGATPPVFATVSGV